MSGIMEKSLAKRVQACRLYSHRGERSLPIDLTVANGDCELPPSDGNDYWLIFVPLHGFEVTGPFYLWREFAEQEVALSPTRTLFVEYLDSELQPDLCPHTAEEALAASLALNEQVDSTRAALIRSEVARMDWPDTLPG